LFLVLALFVDLLIHQGRIPEFAQLHADLRDQYQKSFGELSPERRQQLLAAINAPAEIQKQLADSTLSSDSANEWLWSAYLAEMLDTKVSANAAQTYRDELASTNRPELPRLGFLSLVARRGGTVQTTLGRIAGWSPWMWRPSSVLGPNAPYLIGLTILGVFFALARAGFLNAMNYAAATATLDAASRLRRAIYHHSYRLGTLALQDHVSRENVEIFTRRVEEVHDALYTRITVLICEGVELVLLIALALVVDFWLALASILGAAVVILFGGYLAAMFRDRGRLEARRTSAQLAQLAESLRLMRLVKSNLMDVFNQSRVERQLADYANASFHRFRNDSLFRPLLVFMGTMACIFGLALAGFAVLSGRLGAARLILLVTILAAAYWPLANILAARKVMRRGRSAAIPIFEFLDRPGEIGQVVGAEFLPGITRLIEFRGINLREPGSGRLLLNDLTFKIKAGQRVALVGPDNNEKHAIVYLLMRFLDATTGDILIDDKSLRWLTLESVRAQVGLVMWHDLVFNDTVANNISCGDPSVTLPQIIESAKSAHVHQFVQRLPYGYETPIGEHGASLRRSQRFRIALARAILKDPSLYVIEEPPAPFDDEHKALIDDSLARVLDGKTVIFLAHRISTIRSCDCVYLIHKGQVEAAGEHRELINRSELYKHLHYMEFNEFASLS